ncbi:DM13 domain-containing protein [Pseudarthrobacter sp. LT1]|uniref:DM13 domain-containing protein n=1 Tax=Pseudarthrobacter sp. LT1 TaxID=3111450 RepID=UPI002D76A750|nr:DM13 domain-containing protein [Pseudarthrobacter sp. LT1]WRT11969.1 DM13 domain-containing protein [Pseudarthrobacter sp. LT1]
MKLIQSAVLSVVLAAGLTGCTDSSPMRGPEQGSPTAETAPGVTPSAGPVTLRGQFQSQGAVTTGTVAIHITQAGAVLQLENLATGAGDDLRLMLSPGTLVPGTGGGAGLSSARLIELGPLTGASQRVEMDAARWAALREPIRSVVIYDYAGKTALGTANLQED